MERSTQLTLAQILARLTELLSRKLSGTFFIATDTNTSCRFAIQDGKITHCTHKRDQGMAAIHSFMTINGGSCSFSENQIIPFRAEALVTHVDSLAVLGIKPGRPETPVVTVAPPNTITPSRTPASFITTPPPMRNRENLNNRFYRGYVPSNASLGGSVEQISQGSKKVINPH